MGVHRALEEIADLAVGAPPDAGGVHWWDPTTLSRAERRFPVVARALSE
jgi:hypothetical protein